MKVALVELGNSHDECIYSQIVFLKDAGYKVDGFFNPIIVKQVSSFSHQFTKILPFNFEKLNFYNKIKLTFQLYKALKTYDKVIFNTIRSSTIRDLMLLLKFHNKVECIGVIHNTKKLTSSFTQKIINFKIKKYFVLADHLLDRTITNLKVESFYPIFFLNQKYTHLNQNKNQNWICIPGRVEFKRRNYKGLLEYVKTGKIKDTIKFLILGNINTHDGKIFRDEVIKYKLEKHFIFFDSFIPNKDYFNYIYSSNYILLLLHNDNNYLKYKIAGSYNLAYAFKKPILYSTFYANISDFKENGLPYDETNFIQVCNNLPVKNNLKIYQNDKWKYEYQKNKYLNFITS